jgi:hypothetical protein
MTNRYALLAALCAALLVSGPTDVLAGKPAPSLQPLSGAPQHVQVARSLQRFLTTCTLGAVDPAGFYQDYLYPPDDGYFTLLDPAGCSCAGQGGVLLTTAHVQLHFMDDCTIPVRVGVVAADESDPSCPTPLPGNYICSPTQYDLTGEADGDYDFALPLPTACCINQKAFLEITFLTAGTCAQPPRLIVSMHCDPCAAWNYWAEYLSDLCGPLVGDPMMYVDGACCSTVPATRGSWGRLKTMYR